jgi:hypothetical protein
MRGNTRGKTDRKYDPDKSYLAHSRHFPFSHLLYFTKKTGRQKPPCSEDNDIKEPGAGERLPELKQHCGGHLCAIPLR